MKIRKSNNFKLFVSTKLIKIKNLLINPLKGGIPANDKKLIDNIINNKGFINFKQVKFLNSNKE